METKPQPLDRDELDQLKWLLGGVMALLSAWTAWYVDTAVLPLLAVLTVTGLASTLYPSLPSRVPAVVHRLAFPAIVAAFAADFYITREPIPAFVRLDLLLILYRLIGYRKRRDDLQLIVLGLFLIVIAGVLTVSPLFALQILAFTGCALAFLLAGTLRETARPGQAKADASAHESRPIPEWAGNVEWKHLFQRVRQAVDVRVLGVGLGLFAVLVVMSGFLFLAIPRFEIGNNLFLDRLIQKNARTGFSEQIGFSDVTEIQNDYGLAMTVDVSDPSLLPSMPYWRMLILDQYDGRGFRMSDALRLELQRQPIRGQIEGRARTSDATWTFYLEAGVSRFLPVAGKLNEVVFSKPMNFHFNRRLGLLALSQVPSEMVGFQMRGLQPSSSIPDSEFAASDAVARNLAGVVMHHYRTLDLSPTDRAHLQRVVGEIRGTRELSPTEFATEAAAWLAQQHDYSMRSTLPEGAGDPLVRWLVSNTPGHCEYFAGAFTLLAREAGYAARVVTGFKGGSWNPFSGALSVMNANAHAWCELWDGKSAWVRIDPTPGAVVLSDPSRDEGPGTEVAREIEAGWRARLNGLRVAWYRRVINFDQSAQVEMATVAKDRVQGGVQKLTEGLKGALAVVESWLRQPWSWREIAQVGAMLVVALAAFRLMRRHGPGLWWWWRRRWQRSQEAALDPVRVEAGRWLVRLITGAGERVRDDPLQARLARLRYGPPARIAEARAVFAEARHRLREERRAHRRKPLTER